MGILVHSNNSEVPIHRYVRGSVYFDPVVTNISVGTWISESALWIPTYQLFFSICVTGQVNYSTSTPTYVTGPVPPPRGVINGAYGAPQPRSYYGGSGPSVPTSMNFQSQNMNPAGRNPTMGSTIPMSQTQPFMTQPSVTQPSMNQPLMNQATMPQPATNQQMGMNPADSCLEVQILSPHLFLPMILTVILISIQQ